MLGRGFLEWLRLLEVRLVRLYHQLIMDFAWFYIVLIERSLNF